MKLLQIYECFCDETRLRILHLLTISPLCVSHLQKILETNQVKISKHLAYLKERQMVTASRYENWMLYSISTSGSPELENNLQCLQKCGREYPIFQNDLLRLKKFEKEISTIKKALNEQEKSRGKNFCKGREICI